MATKVDARAITTTYAAYDGLNRVTGKSYNDTPQTPSVAYAYGDNQTGCYAKGRLTQVTSGIVANTYSCFDAVGRTIQSAEAVGTTAAYRMSYVYDLAGELTSFTFPSGRQESLQYDTAGRPKAIGGSGNATYAQSFSWFPNGALQTVSLGPSALLSGVHSRRY